MKLRIHFTTGLLRRVLLSVWSILGLVCVVVCLYMYISEPWSEPTGVRVTNMTDRSVTVTWVTSEKTRGYVLLSRTDSFKPGIFARLGTEASIDDRDVTKAVLEAARKQDAKVVQEDSDTVDYGRVAENIVWSEMGHYYVHAVTLRDLEPSSEYFFKIGNGLRFRDAASKTFTTLPPSEEISLPDPAYGLVSRPKGSMSNQVPVDDGIMYVQIRTADGEEVSTMLSSLLSENGSWYVDLGNARQQDGRLYMESFTLADQTGMMEELEVVAGSYGSIERTISIDRDAPAAKIIVISDDAKDDFGEAALYEEKAECAVPESDGVPCEITYTQADAYLEGNSCSYNCIGSGHCDGSGLCVNEWASGSICEKVDPECGEICEGGEQCWEGQICSEGDEQCCMVPCVWPGQEQNITNADVESADMRIIAGLINTGGAVAGAGDVTSKALVSTVHASACDVDCSGKPRSVCYSHAGSGCDWAGDVYSGSCVCTRSEDTQPEPEPAEVADPCEDDPSSDECAATEPCLYGGKKYDCDFVDDGCTGGRFEPGYCPGSSAVQCCVTDGGTGGGDTANPCAANPSSNECAATEPCSYGGKTYDCDFVSEGCSGGQFVPNYCGGDSTVQCCVTGQVVNRPVCGCEGQDANGNWVGCWFPDGFDCQDEADETGQDSQAWCPGGIPSCRSKECVKGRVCNNPCSEPTPPGQKLCCCDLSNININSLEVTGADLSSLCDWEYGTACSGVKTRMSPQVCTYEAQTQYCCCKLDGDYPYDCNSSASVCTGEYSPRPMTDCAEPDDGDQTCCCYEDVSTNGTVYYGSPEWSTTSTCPGNRGVCPDSACEDVEKRDVQYCCCGKTVLGSTVCGLSVEPCVEPAVSTTLGSCGVDDGLCSSKWKENNIGLSVMCNCDAGCSCKSDNVGTKGKVPYAHECSVPSSECKNMPNGTACDIASYHYCMNGECVQGRKVLPVQGKRTCRIKLNEFCPAASQCPDDCYCSSDTAGFVPRTTPPGKQCSLKASDCKKSDTNTFGSACGTTPGLYCNTNGNCNRMSETDAADLRTQYQQPQSQLFRPILDTIVARITGFADDLGLVGESIAQEDVETFGDLVLIPELGVYTLGIGEEYTVEGIEVGAESDRKLFVYVDKNGDDGYQEGEDEVLDVRAYELTLSKQSSLRTYYIRQGSNLVSFPVVLDGRLGRTMASDMLSYLNSDYDDAFYSLAKFEDGRWFSVENRIGATYGSEDFQIIPGRGYLLKAKSDVEIQISGKEVAEPVPVAMVAGWNLIGVHGADVSYTASSLIDAIDTGGVLDSDNVTEWEASTSRYSGLQKEPVDDGSVQVYGFDFPIDDKLGYFVRIAEGSGVWVPE